MERNSARQIRFAFLLHAWNATLDYSENVLREAEQTDKLFNVSQGCFSEFFLYHLTVIRPEPRSLFSLNFTNIDGTIFHRTLFSAISEKMSGQRLKFCKKVTSYFFRAFFLHRENRP